MALLEVLLSSQTAKHCNKVNVIVIVNVNVNVTIFVIFFDLVFLLVMTHHHSDQLLERSQVS